MCARRYSSQFVLLTLLARTITQTLQRFYMATSLLLKHSGQNSLSAEALEDLCVMMAQRLSILHGLNAPRADKTLFRHFIQTLLQQGVLHADAQGVGYHDKLGELAEGAAKRVLSGRAASSIRQVALHRDEPSDVVQVACLLPGPEGTASPCSPRSTTMNCRSNRSTSKSFLPATTTCQLPPRWVHLFARRVPCRRAGRQPAELRLQCAGVMPIKLQLACDLSQLDPARQLHALAVRIEQNGQLQFINTTHHAVNPTPLSGTERVVVDNGMPTGSPMID